MAQKIPAAKGTGDGYAKGSGDGDGDDYLRRSGDDSVLANASENSHYLVEHLQVVYWMR